MNKDNKIKKFIYALSYANFFDAGSIVATGLAMPFWTIAFGISGFQIGVLGALGSNAFGAAIGALISGFFSDIIGRKKTYSYGLYIFLLGSLCCLIAFNYACLILGFLFMGISVGMCVPTAWTYLSEISLSKERSSNLGISQIARPLAIVSMYVIFFFLSILLSSYNEDGNIIPAETNDPSGSLLVPRLIFVVLCVISISSIISQRNLSEAKPWLKSNNTKNKNNFHNIKKLFFSKKTFLAILFLIITYTPWNIVAGTISQFMPSIAKACEIEGVSLAIISLIVCVLSILSVVLFSKLTRKFSYRSLFLFGSITGVLAIVFMLLFDLQYIYLKGQFWFFIIIFAIFWGLQTGFSAQCFYSIWSSELFPTKIRGSIEGFMFFIVRAISGVWALIVFGLFDSSTAEGAVYALVTMIVLLLITLIVGAIWCPNTKDKKLEDIAKERYGEL